MKKWIFSLQILKALFASGWYCSRRRKSQYHPFASRFQCGWGRNDRESWVNLDSSPSWRKSRGHEKECHVKPWKLPLCPCFLAFLLSIPGQTTAPHACHMKQWDSWLWVKMQWCIIDYGWKCTGHIIDYVLRDEDIIDYLKP